ncbi:Putative MetA-pathway of phenol degradation [Nitrosomonas communis]|uniref:Putative MetA-pathway of phenol degradation n=1 Tax=Nitrosomonas communis TaxID=44574 RepID=A0A1H2S8V7_9PROT|nr:Putative MetA-pathway of phenol degradation [Nitrosomonas communis]
MYHGELKTVKLRLTNIKKRVKLLNKAENCSSEARLPAVRNLSLISLIILLSIVRPIYAQNPAAADPDIQFLLQKINERDEVIEDLKRRVKVLESQQEASKPQQQSRSTAVAPANQQAQSSDSPSTAEKPVQQVSQQGTSKPQQQLPSAAVAPASQQAQSPDNSPTAEKPVQQAQTDAKPQSQAKEKPSAGEFEVDALAAERALDRSLIQAGALLLPFLQMELQPFVNYARRDNDFPLLVTNDLGQLIGARTADVKRNEFDTGFFFRAGLPFESQLELRLPARIVNEETILPQGATNLIDTTRTGASLGDISVGIAKTLFRESIWLPDLIGRFTWDSDSGKITSNNVLMGSGFNDFRVSLVALKRQDPLAFTTSFDYQTSLKKNGIDRGDQYTFSFAASLAASPYSSLSLGLQQVWRDKTRISGANVVGSDDAVSIASFGVTTMLTRKLFLTVTGGIGLTKASPDYLVNISLPYRFAY